MTFMSKRVQVTLPDRLAAELEQWADSDGRPLSNLCAFLLEQSVKQAKQTGEFPDNSEQEPQK
jgi:hypothetical protein